MNETRVLADYLVDLRYRDLAQSALERAKDLILDQLGVELAASTKPWSVAIYKYVRDLGGRKESTIFNYGDRATAENAAFANATFGHGFELDDTYLRGITHPGCVIVPSALAVGEKEMASGRDLLLAVISGYEAIGAIAVSVAPSCSRRGSHTVAAIGPFGAATVTAKLLDFDHDLMLNALSVAGSHCSGLREFTETGGNIKRMHAGLAASNGIRAALLAKAGITGPPTVLEGRKGFCRVYSDDYAPEKITTNLGKEFVVHKIAIKRYCCCYHIQGPIEATSRLIREHRIKPGDIDEIVMGTTKDATAAVGVITEPTEVTAAQFSAPFSLAMAAVKGSNGFNDYTEANLSDPEIKALARRVRLEVDPEVQAKFPMQRAIRMTIKLRDGSRHQQWLEGALGTPENPMTARQVEDKFGKLASLVLTDAKVKEVAKVVRGLDDVANVTTLSRLLIA